MPFDLKRYTQFVNDCRDRGIGLPTVANERTEHEYARQHYLRQKYPDPKRPYSSERGMAGKGSQRMWAGSMTTEQHEIQGAVPWFVYAEDPAVADTGALRMFGGEQFWKERAELAEGLLRDLEGYISLPKMALAQFEEASRKLARADGLTPDLYKELMDAVRIMDQWNAANEKKKAG